MLPFKLRHRASSWFGLALALAPAGCNYVKLARPNVIGQLHPDLVGLVNFLPSIDNPNEATLGRLIGTGGLMEAERDSAGFMRARVRVPRDQFIWRPSVVVMPEGGVLELEFSNEDPVLHQALLTSEGGKEFLDILPRSRGVARIRLDQPGMYSFGCPVGNHAGRGMIGIIIVRGQAPAEARLDRPGMPRP
jgi:PQQ system protein